MTFGVLSPDEIETLAPRIVWDNAVYAKNLPKLGGPNDPGLGPSDRRVVCSTCHNTFFGCPGHTGAIRLPMPLYHPGFFDHVYKILQCTCWACGKPLGAVPPRDPKERGVTAFHRAFDLGKARSKCPWCTMPQPKYSKESKALVIKRDFGTKLDAVLEIGGPLLHAAAMRKFTPSEARDILANISDEDSDKMGMPPKTTRPEWMVLAVLPVLPPNARPAIMASEGSKRRGQDDITAQIQDIVKACRGVRKAILRAKEPALFRGRRAATAAASASGANKAATADNGSVSVGTGPGAAAATTPATVGVGDDDASCCSTSIGPTASVTTAAASRAHQSGGMTATALLNARLATAEFEVCGAAPARAVFTDATARALRFALKGSSVIVDVSQAAAIWEAHPAACEKLQNAVANLYDNSGKYAPQTRQRAGRVRATTFQRLSGKQGRVRANLVAKRMDQNARTVIVPDGSNDVNELGVPRVTTEVLTKPEVVNSRNAAALQQAVVIGHGKTGGASRILHLNGSLTQLQYVDDATRRGIQLQPGDVVDRHLCDGDIILFNRQPSLHKLSLMAHRVQTIDGLAAALGLADTTVYNADFDGDEMNMHAPQDLLAMADAAELMAVDKNVMNPQTNAPCLSLVQDSRVGASLLTHRDTWLTRDQMDQCMGVIRHPVVGKETRPPPALPAGTLPGQTHDLWSGKQLASLLLPHEVFLEKRVRGAGPDVGPDDPQERFVVIEAGVLKHGRLCKGTLGEIAGGIVHRIAIAADSGRCPQTAAVDFLSDFQRVVYAWLPFRGLTMGLADCVMARADIDAAAAAVDEIVAGLTREADELKEHMTSVEIARVEAGILTILTATLDAASRAVLQHAAEGGFRAMVDSGSKGNPTNLAQIMAYLGQQVVDGARIAPAGPSCRTLPMFSPGAFSAGARGFIANSYLTGLQPHEYYAHMQAGREGVIQTAVGTAETGYKYRSMAKAQETHTARWDGTVRNAQEYVVEFVAGGDGMDPTRLERVRLDVLLMDNATIVEECQGDAALAQTVTQLRDDVRFGLLSPLYPEFSPVMLLPVNIKDELRNAAYTQASKRIKFRDDNDLEGGKFREEVKAIVQGLVEQAESVVASPEATVAIRLSLWYDCRPKALVKAGVTLQVFKDTVAPLLSRRIRGAVLAPGESVGVVAAQSIGEPSTQFTLDAFHQAGLMQRRISMGVPRLKELLHASDKVATPCMVVPLRSANATKEDAAKFGRALEHLSLDSVLHSSYCTYDPAGDGHTTPLTTMFEDAALMQTTAALYGPEVATGNVLCPWIIRFVLNRSILMEHGLTPEDVARAIVHALPSIRLKPNTSANNTAAAKRQAAAVAALAASGMATSTLPSTTSSSSSSCAPAAAHNGNGAVPFIAVFSQPNMAQWVLRLRPINESASETCCRSLHARVRNGVVLGGISRVRDTRPIQTKTTKPDPCTGAMATHARWAVDTDGSSLRALQTWDAADWENTVTNDVLEVESVLGLAAARGVLFAEIDKVITSDGGYVDARHLRSLVNTMTHRGYVMPITRHGINRVDHSVLHRASYEETVEMLVEAAVTGEEDCLAGMCPAVLAGQKPPIGTGTVTVVNDIDDMASFEAAATQRRRALLSRCVSVSSLDQARSGCGNGRASKRIRPDLGGQRPQRLETLSRRASTTTANADIAWASSDAPVKPKRIPKSLPFGILSGLVEFRPVGTSFATGPSGIGQFAMTTPGGTCQTPTPVVATPSPLIVSNSTTPAKKKRERPSSPSALLL